jgi:hypothetical protein
MSRSPVVLNLNGAKGHAKAIKVGDSYSHPITYEFPDGSPIDKGPPLSWLSQIRTKPLSPLIVATFTVTVSGAFNNIVTISLTDDETKLLDPGEYHWDLEETNPGVSVWTKAEGVAIVKSDVSRL